MKTRKSIYKIGLFALTLLVMGTGCKKQLDINEDPNNPAYEQGTPAIVFPAGTLGTVGGLGSDYQILGAIWSQYVTQSAVSSQYKNIDAYTVQSSDFNTSYANVFSRGLNSYKYVVDKTRESADWSYYLMANVMKGYTTAIMVDMYDQLPYTEAFQGTANLQPKFDDGHSIYLALIDSIDNALSKDFSALTVSTTAIPSFGPSDLVFKGDINKWIEFANTLKLKLYLRMVNKYPDVAQAGIKAMYDAGDKFVTYNVGVTNFTNNPGLDNPFYDYNIRTLNTPDNLRASQTFVSWLQLNADPRVTAYFNTAAPTAINQGDFGNQANANYPKATVFYQTATDPIMFISAAESYFLQAEVAVRYGLGDAKALYNQGVLAAFTATGKDGSSFIAAGGKYEWGNEKEGGVTLGAIEQIIRQKWAHFAWGTHALEAFFDKNRTGFPKTSAVYSTSASYIPGQWVISAGTVLPAGQMPKRVVFPDNERQRNNNTPSVSDNPITKAVWWAL
ncbi:SusD/RagB family nutrient-binding outer membrane lipoprotein [Pinibacter aurantiacus]|uniref:SusD/RagB family nutrient-binding outer membrane lipoprotein n=1 Tax=Pinibacter aurantiacus TaxID=2851599 RepID=A0A9E2SBB6_9BACT|nr:SusD/RagB family nutrient-binding outer membrane lipoprotein [Pinibacter aurantiacus]MBV4358177.1 SusD/RagB family nutrient-binding outer membrane lipoprotein [Pinibacter aurantiacus]